MKGPMTTQSLPRHGRRGPMHWRGDRSGAVSGNSSLALDEDLAFKEFNPAFVGLLGAAQQLLPAEMQAFSDFIPHRPLSAEPDPRHRQRPDGARRQRGRASSPP
jgi:hypothetical protein